jgi:hypothetical protein
MSRSSTEPALAVMAASEHTHYGVAKGAPAQRGPGRPPGARNKSPHRDDTAPVPVTTLPRPMPLKAWRELVGIGNTTYFQLRKEGRMPDELRVGSRIFITPEAHQRWVRKNTSKARPQP